MCFATDCGTFLSEPVKLTIRRLFIYLYLLTQIKELMKLGEEGFTKSNAESIYYLIYAFDYMAGYTQSKT